MCMLGSWQFPDGGKEFLELCGANCAVDMHLKDGQTLGFGVFTFTVVHTAGHSPGHITMYDRQRGVVICGDVALGWGAVVPDQPLISPYYYSPDLYLAGIEKIMSPKGEFYCNGHAGVLSSGVMEDQAERSIELVRSLEKWSLAAVDGTEPRSLSTIAHRVVKHTPL
jgi:glyoxylase-like metal-dependent hydrolase (beta-lactamase superfamily II)